MEPMYDLDGNRLADPVIPTLLHPDTVANMRGLLGRRFQASDLTSDLAHTAVEYVRSYAGRDHFLVDLGFDLRRYGDLTPNQIAAALNTIATMHSIRSEPTPEPFPAGYYTVPPGITLRVSSTPPSLWPGRRMLCAGIGWLGADGAIELRPDISPDNLGAVAFRRLLAATLDERAEMTSAYAALTGCCARCGRTLTNPDSVERGMGPICSRRAGW